jgi:hypothetical protein
MGPSHRMYSICIKCQETYLTKAVQREPPQFRSNENALRNYLLNGIYHIQNTRWSRKLEKRSMRDVTKQRFSYQISRVQCVSMGLGTLLFKIQNLPNIHQTLLVRANHQLVTYIVKFLRSRPNAPP